MLHGKIKHSLLLVVLVVVFCAQLVAMGSIPQPQPMPPAGTWQLEFVLHGVPRPISVCLPGDDKPTHYWYLLYTVVNNTGQDVNFVPRFSLLTDTFCLYHSPAHTPDSVFAAIQKLYANTIPLLESQEMVSGKLLQGKDNARDSVIIFPDFDPNATSVKVFIEGLSNETVAVTPPKGTKNTNKKPKKVLLQKTLMLKYKISGDAYDPQNRVLLYRNRKWIMR